MLTSKAGQRYALALLQIAEEFKKLNIIIEDFKNIESLIQKSRDFLLFLRSPIINTEKKKKVIISIFKDKVDELTYKFLLLLVAKNRESLLPSIVKNFWQLLDKKNGIVNVELTTVVTPSDEQIEGIKKRLEAITKSKVRLHLKSDFSLIGGFIIKLEDTVFDASVLQQFENLRKKFLLAPLSTKSK